MRDRSNKSNDRLVATTPPVPAVTFPDDETAQTIIAPNKQTYDNAVAYVAQQTAQADACQADVDTWRQEIRDREAWIERRELEKQAALQQVQRGQRAAKVAAELLALLGAPVPPPNGELSHDPDGSLARFDQAHAELDAAGGVR